MHSLVLGRSEIFSDHAFFNQVHKFSPHLGFNLRMKERDDPTQKKKEEVVVSGWGSWTGAAPPPPRKQRKLPPKLGPPKNANIIVKNKYRGSRRT